MKIHPPIENTQSVLQGQEREVISSYLSSHIGTLKSSDIQLSNIKTRYIEGGQGTPLIFLHGLGANKAYFRSLMKSFSKSFHVIAPDVPGFYPKAQLRNSKHHLRNLSLWLEEFTSALNLRNIIVVGNSLGANLAAYHACQHPSNVEKMCLISFAQNFDENGANIRMVVDTVFKTMSSTDQIDQLLEFCFYNPPDLPNIVKKRMLKDAVAYQPFISEMLDSIYNSHIQLLAKIGQIQCPTLLLSGDEDLICPIPFAQKLNQVIPNTELHILGKSKHMTFLERHRLVEKLITDFIE